MARPIGSIYIRLAEKVLRTGPDDCWIWRGGLDEHGYGSIRLPGAKGRLTGAHRVAWEQVHGPIPRNLYVLHRCDNPPCCNPAHLFLGTKKDNSQDMSRKGRAAAQQHPERVARGERQHSAKLTSDDVRTIRQRYATGTVSGHQLAREFGVSQPNIRMILLKKTWKHI